MPTKSLEEDNNNSNNNDERESNKKNLLLVSNETSSLLLLPSPNSTNRPSMSNLLEYGTLVSPVETTAGEDDEELNDDAEPLIQMHNNNPNHIGAGGDDGSFLGDDAWPFYNTIQKSSKKAERERHLLNILLGISSFLLVVIVGLLGYSNSSASSHSYFHHHPHKNQQQQQQPPTPGNYPPPHSSSKDRSSSNSGTPNSIRHQQAPFSIKHPVDDLNVQSFQRPSFSSPNRELFLPMSSSPQQLLEEEEEAGEAQQKLQRQRQNQKHPPLPTNSWYQNLVLVSRNEPTQEQRVYPVPYVVDVVGPIPGIRIHNPTVVASATVIQLTQILEHGLTLGAASRQSILALSSSASSTTPLSKKYKISKMTPLGITLEWRDETHTTTTTSATSSPLPLTYSSSIVRGMPYATMQYNSHHRQQRMSSDAEEQQPLPTIASETPIGAPPVLDGTTKLNCDYHGTNNNTVGQSHWVQKEVQMEFKESDYTWLVFVSRPVRVRCIIPPPLQHEPEFIPGLPVPSPGIVFALQFLDNDEPSDHSGAKPDHLVIRMALADDCTHGMNPITCGRRRQQQQQQQQQQNKAVVEDPVAYAKLLRRHADLYPGPNTDVSFDFSEQSDDYQEEEDNGGADVEHQKRTTNMKFHWDVQSMSRRGRGEVSTAAVVALERGSEKSDDKKAADEEDDSSPEEGKGGGNLVVGDANLLMYALPHHQDMILGRINTSSSLLGIHNKAAAAAADPSFPTTRGGEAMVICKTSLLGPACLVSGSTWNLREDFKDNWETSFRAPRPPQGNALPHLVKAHKQDLNFELPSYFQRGAGDTYFSGKMLAKLGRILTIGEELFEVCNPTTAGGSPPDECNGLDIPSPRDAVFLDALARLRSSVEVWINGTADTPFVYDDEWGGLVSCGCNFDESRGACYNKYPNCPAFYNPGLDFGNAFYNDHHFHLGYHIYAAAAVAHFDPQWGRDHFEQVLLFVRDIANPSHYDGFFPTFRNKDWYQGSSWASGTSVTPLNGRNQESSSEAIAAYEGVALFGMEMVKAWTGENENNRKVAKEIQSYGEILMASEVRSADRYWHVIEARNRQQYPVQYTPHVVGIMWTTMAQFQTWFGGDAYLAYGIQLLPLTAISEKRDSMDWVKELYEPFAESCDAHFNRCRDGGWSVLVLAILASVGHQEEAINKALQLPADAFTSAGGNGHSLTNTLWYLATRPQVDEPLVIDKPRNDNKQDETAALEKEMHRQSDNPTNGINGQPAKDPEPRAPVVIDPNFNCSCPDSCNENTLSHFAGGHSCRDRIVWLMTEKDHSEWDACHQVGLEFPGQCSACDPRVCSIQEETHSKTCPPCSKTVCAGKLNQCPIQSAPFLCTKGASIGGCAQAPWSMKDGVCEGCCELSLGCEL